MPFSARLVDVDDHELRVRELLRGGRDRVALREADAEDQVVALARERRHVRDVVGRRLRLEHAALDAELLLRPLQPLVRELVEAAVVELAEVGDQRDLERLPPPVVVSPAPSSSSPPQAPRARTSGEQCGAGVGSSRFSTVSLKLVAESSTHVALGVVLQVRDARLHVLLWQRAKAPAKNAWALPGGYLDARETLEASIRRHLAAKVDVRELAHLEQLETRSEPRRYPRERQLATAYLGLVPAPLDPTLPADTRWHPLDELPTMAFDHGEITLAGKGAAARSSRTRTSASPSRPRRSRSPSCATSTPPRSATRSRRRTCSASSSAAACSRRRGAPRAGPSGGRPPELFRFGARELEVTDPSPEAAALSRRRGGRVDRDAPQRRHPGVAATTPPLRGLELMRELGVDSYRSRSLAASSDGRANRPGSTSTDSRNAGIEPIATLYQGPAAGAAGAGGCRDTAQASPTTRRRRELAGAALSTTAGGTRPRPPTGTPGTATGEASGGTMCCSRTAALPELGRRQVGSPHLTRSSDSDSGAAWTRPTRPRPALRGATTEASGSRGGRRGVRRRSRADRAAVDSSASTTTRRVRRTGASGRAR